MKLTRALHLVREEGVTFIPAVPAVLNAFCLAAEQGLFPREHRLRFVKSGAAPLAADLGRRFISLTGVPVVQGYGMTEASPVTHIGVAENCMEMRRFDWLAGGANRMPDDCGKWRGMLRWRAGRTGDARTAIYARLLARAGSVRGGAAAVAGRRCGRRTFLAGAIARGIGRAMSRGEMSKACTTSLIDARR